MRFDIFCPFNISVGRVCEVSRFQHEKHILTCHNVDYRFENRTYVPCNPLLTVSEQNEQSVCDSDCRNACVKVAGDVFIHDVVCENSAINLDECKQVADYDCPNDDSEDYQYVLQRRERFYYCKLLVFLVGVFVPHNKADRVFAYLRINFL